MEKEISRRSFIKGGAIAAAGAAGAAAFSTVANAAEEPERPFWIPEVWDYETEVLIIGYGGAGIWSGLTAYDEGAQVMFLEKAPYRGGGSSSFNMGQWTAPHDADAAAQFAFESFQGQTPKAVCQAWADEAVQNPDMFDKYGVEFTLGESPRAEYEIFTGFDQMYVAQGTGWGIAFFDVMDEHVKNRNIPILFDCHDEELIQNPMTKEIIGCWTLIGDDPERKAVKASKGVVLCTGGFEFSIEKQEKYLKCYPQYFYGWKYNTGDGIDMALKVGADLWHMQTICGGDIFFYDDPEVVGGAISIRMKANNYIKVNRLGVRWGEPNVSPHGGWKVYTSFDESICGFDKIPTWYIFDDTVFKAGPIGGQAGSASGGGFNMGYTAEGFREFKELGGWDGWSDDNEFELGRGWIKKGETLDDLAKAIQGFDKWMDAEKLKASVARWNELCEKGVDEDFERAETTLAPIVTPPFYAMPMYPGTCNTGGGARRNEKAQVLNPDGVPIPRLYSAGSFGNMAGHTYAITGGNGSENACVGRISGRNVAALDNWDNA